MSALVVAYRGTLKPERRVTPTPLAEKIDVLEKVYPAGFTVIERLVDRLLKDKGYHDRPGA